MEKKSKCMPISTLFCKKQQASAGLSDTFVRVTVK